WALDARLSCRMAMLGNRVIRSGRGVAGAAAIAVSVAAAGGPTAVVPTTAPPAAHAAPGVSPAAVIRSPQRPAARRVADARASAAGDISKTILEHQVAFDKALLGALSEAQVHRLKQVYLQVLGASAVLDRRIIPALDLTADQEDEIEKVLPPASTGMLRSAV